jgi:hypothetical protein
MKIKKNNQMNPDIVANFHEWMKLYHPDKIQFNPTVIEIKEGKIIFGMYKHMGRLSFSIEKINLDLEIKISSLKN